MPAPPASTVTPLPRPRARTRVTITTVSGSTSIASLISVLHSSQASSHVAQERLASAWPR